MDTQLIGAVAVWEVDRERLLRRALKGSRLTPDTPDVAVKVEREKTIYDFAFRLRVRSGNCHKNLLLLGYGRS
jgi:hypothetical protein